MILEAGNSRTSSVDLQAEDPGQLMVQMKSKGILLENSLLFEEASFCCCCCSIWAFN